MSANQAWKVLQKDLAQPTVGGGPNLESDLAQPTVGGGPNLESDLDHKSFAWHAIVQRQQQHHRKVIQVSRAHGNF